MRDGGPGDNSASKGTLFVITDCLPQKLTTSKNALINHRFFFVVVFVVFVVGLKAKPPFLH